jgi:hypothetical protein
MLVSHRELTSGPPVSDGAQGGAEQIEIDGYGLHTRGQGGLDHCPGPGFVPGDQPLLEVAPAGRAGPAPPGRFLAATQFFHFRRGHLILPALPMGSQASGAHVPVGGHVVNVQALGHLL